MTKKADIPRAAGTRRRVPSLRDVADHAGVSAQTVSRVANGVASVRGSTRQRVLTSMQILGYRPNRAARALRSGRFGNIGVVTSTSSHGNTRILAAIAASAALAGYSIAVMQVETPTQRDVSGALDRLSEQAVDGIIVLMEADIIGRGEVELPPGFSVVLLDSADHPDYPQVGTDHVLGARQATQHLLDLGHQTVWHISGPPDSYAAARRESSWRCTLEEAGAPVPAAFRGDWSTAAGYRHGREIAVRPEITAVFAANDRMALGVLRALHEAGRRVPEDVSIVGFDDMSESDSFWPPLTTVHQEFETIGRRALELLITEIEAHPQPISSTVLPTRLVTRASTGPAPERYT